MTPTDLQALAESKGVRIAPKLEQEPESGAWFHEAVRVPKWTADALILAGANRWLNEQGVAVVKMPPGWVDLDHTNHESHDPAAATHAQAVTEASRRRLEAMP